MPSPFPGMDPYLENPSLWPDVHNELISAIRAQLNTKLTARYVARLEERVYISDDDVDRGPFVPDVSIADQNGHGPQRGRGRKAKADAGDSPVVVTTVMPDEVHEHRAEVRDAETDAVVAVIEVLSPSNKVHGSAGRDSFLRKRREILASDAHWCEIDLLRAGMRPGFDRRLRPHDYVVHVSPADLRPKGHVWPIGLKDRLPTVSIPLRGTENPVPLDLQACLDMAYERGAYQKSARYRDECVPSLPPPLAKWADGVLKAKGLR